MSDLLHIIGAGGSATEIKHAAQVRGIPVAGLFVEEKFVEEALVPVHSLNEIEDPERLKMICSIANVDARERLVKEYRRADFVNVIHPSAVFPEYLMGRGCYIGAGVVISPNVVLGSHVQIHNGAIIGHDTRIGDCVTILPGVIVAGNCFIGFKSFIGAGASIMQNVVVGAESMVGMGAVVIKDVREGTVVAGIPAQEIHIDKSGQNGRR